MQSEIICVGTELLKGFINTNNAYISERLAGLGFKPKFETSVVDDINCIKTAFSTSISRSDIIICTGGLGPTFDDVTREALSKAINKKLVFDEDVMNIISKYVSRYTNKMTKNNKRQAYVIEGARILNNRLGTAPAMIVEVSKNKIVALLPGPPIEMIEIFEEQVVPFLRNKFKSKLGIELMLKISGLGESKAEEMIQPVINKKRNLKNLELDFAILAKPGIIELKAFVLGKELKGINKLIKKIKQEFKQILGNYIFGENSDTLQSVVGKILTKKNKTLSVAESCTGGMLSDKITDIPGSSLYFIEGIVAYSNKAKIRLLGVKDNTIKKFGAVSSETAKEMALNVRLKSNSDIGLGITGIAGPTGAVKDKPIGLVYISISTKNNLKVWKYNFHGERKIIKELTVNTALDNLRREIIN